MQPPVPATLRLLLPSTLRKTTRFCLVAPATPHTWRTTLAVALRRLAWRIDRSNLPLLSGGQWCIFSAAPSRFNMPAWTVQSVRGQFGLGVIEWSPQWRAYRFRPAADLVCNGGMLAEVYAFLRHRGAVTGRFV